MTLPPCTFVLLSLFVVACGQKPSTSTNELSKPSANTSAATSAGGSETPLASIPQNGGPYTYGPGIVSLQGTLVSATGETPDGNSIAFPALQLATKITVNGSPPDDPTESDVVQLQMMMTDKDRPIFERLKGSRATVTGRLFHADNGHHHTRVLINTVSILGQVNPQLNTEVTASTINENQNLNVTGLYSCGKSNGIIFFPDGAYIDEYFLDNGKENIPLIFSLGTYNLAGSLLTVKINGSIDMNTAKPKSSALILKSELLDHDDASFKTKRVARLLDGVPQSELGAGIESCSLKSKITASMNDFKAKFPQVYFEK